MPSFTAIFIVAHFVLVPFAEGVALNLQVANVIQPARSEPSFAQFSVIDTERSSANVTAALGKTALLTCRTRGLDSNRTQVSWIRYRDLQLLAVGDVVYVADPRFIASVTTTVVSSGTAGGGSSDSAAAPGGGGGGGQHFHQWSLQIQNVQEKDAGRYECQVGGAATPRISRLVRLAVVETMTTILLGSEMLLNVGSTINLTCLVRHTPDPPDHIFWTHNQQTVNYDSKRGGISVMVERGPETTLSSLLIQKATRKDSGIYVCSPSSAPAASTAIHVLEGELPAAMHSDAGLQHGPTVTAITSALAILKLISFFFFYSPSHIVIV